MDRAELKAAARSQIKGKVGILFLITLIIALVSGFTGAILSLLPGGELVVSIIITPAFSLSIANVYLGVIEGYKPSVGDVVSGFDDFWSAFKVIFFVGLFIFLWSLLFLIPGIIKSYSYSMSMFILAENEGKPALECISESKEMTDGYKLDLFLLGLSFIGWELLGVITFGIAFIWVIPYVQATYANAYKCLKPDTMVEEQPYVETVVVE